MLETFNDYPILLMRILDKLHDRAGESKIILILFERIFHDILAPSQYTKNKSGNIRWEQNVRWSREKLKSLGFVDSPRRGVWRLTEEGHKWLAENPDRYIMNSDDTYLIKERKNIQTTPVQEYKISQFETKEKFLSTLQINLPNALRAITGTLKIDFYLRSYYLKIYLTGFTGCHYEIVLRPSKHEIALHFEGSNDHNLARFRGFEPHLDVLKQSLKLPLYAGKYQNKGWMKICVESQAQPYSQDLISEYTDLVLRFVAATFPILREIYANDAKIHQHSIIKEKPTDYSSLHKILEQEVKAIRAYLQGQSSLQLSDEKLCDWIHFCYIFRMYSEGMNLFSLVCGTEVNPWYYERTKKIAKLCALHESND